MSTMGGRLPTRYLYAQRQDERFAVPRLFLLTVTLDDQPPLKCSAFGRTLDEALERLMEKYPHLQDFGVLTPKGECT